jgi:hypothetical protein
MRKLLLHSSLAKDSKEAALWDGFFFTLRHPAGADLAKQQRFSDCRPDPMVMTAEICYNQSVGIRMVFG